MFQLIQLILQNLTFFCFTLEKSHLFPEAVIGTTRARITSQDEAKW